MKNFRNVIKGFVIAAVVLAVFSQFLLVVMGGGVMSSTPVLKSYESVVLILVCLLVGLVLYLNFENKVVHSIGFALMTAGELVAVYVAFDIINSSSSIYYSNFSLSVSPTLSSLCIFVISLIMMLIYKILSFKYSEDNVTGLEAQVALINQWKELLDAGIISKEEFEDKRVGILKINKKK